MIKIEVKYDIKKDVNKVAYKRDNSNAYEHLFAMAFLKERLLEKDYTFEEIVEMLKEISVEEAIVKENK